MKKILLYSLSYAIMTTSCYSMDRICPTEKVSTVAFLTNEKLAIGGVNGFAFVTKKNSKEMLIRRENNTPATFSIIPSYDKKKVAFLCKHRCYIYDTKTETKIDYYYITDGDNDPTKISYSAAFSSVDNTFFIYQNKKLTFDGKSIELAYTANNSVCGIACHPKEKKIVYPCSSRSLSFKQFDICNKNDIDTIVSLEERRMIYTQPIPSVAVYNPTALCSLDEQIHKENIIKSVVYNPYNEEIFLLLNNHTVCRYNPETEQLTYITPPVAYRGIAFMQHYPVLGMLCDNAIQYCDSEGKPLLKEVIFTNWDNNNNTFGRTLDFSPSGTEYAAVINEKLVISPINLGMIKIIYLRAYCRLKNYCIENFIPMDILKLLIKTLLMLHPRYPI